MKKVKTTGVAMISMRPTFVERVFTGQKTVELRRTRPSLAEGDTVFVYCSAPVSALIGTFAVVEIIEEEVDRLWMEVFRDAGVSREEYDSYFENARVGFGIRFERLVELDDPIPLERLRNDLGGFAPPQCFNYFRDNLGAIMSLLRYMIDEDAQEPLTQMAIPYGREAAQLLLPIHFPSNQFG